MDCLEDGGDLCELGDDPLLCGPRELPHCRLFSDTESSLVFESRPPWLLVLSVLVHWNSLMSRGRMYVQERLTWTSITLLFQSGAVSVSQTSR